MYISKNANEITTKSIVFGRSSGLRASKRSWPVACKEMVATGKTIESSKQALDAFGLPNCKQCC